MSENKKRKEGSWIKVSRKEYQPQFPFCLMTSTVNERKETHGKPKLRDN